MVTLITPVERFLLNTVLGSVVLFAVVNALDLVLAHWPSLRFTIAITTKLMSVVVISIWFSNRLGRLQQFSHDKQRLLNGCVVSLMALVYCLTTFGMSFNMETQNLLMPTLTKHNLICERICPESIWFEFLERREEYLDRFNFLIPEIPGERV